MLVYADHPLFVDSSQSRFPVTIWYPVLHIGSVYVRCLLVSLLVRLLRYLLMVVSHILYNLLVIPDEQYGEPINLMSWLAADNVIKLSQLKDFDFNNLEFNFYDGSVY